MATSILVYIPCHTDFHEALDQAKRLRKDFEIYQTGSKFLFDRLDIVVSINHFEPEFKDKIYAESLCNKVYYYGNALLADVNISQGFIEALHQKPDIFWLLSANDTLIDGALIHILQEFEKDPDLDLIVANSFDFSGSFYESEILNPQPISYHYGLISGVIYRTKKVIRFFNTAPFFPWTGWSQLAVIQSAMKGNGMLKISTLPIELLFRMPEREIQHNAKIYAHSFLGGLIQTLIFEKSDKSKRKFLRNFVFKNFYLIHFFSQRDRINDKEIEIISSKHYLSWNRIIAESLIKSYTPFTHLWYKFFKQIPFENMASNRFLLKIKKILKSH